MAAAISAVNFADGLGPSVTAARVTQKNASHTIQAAQINAIATNSSSPCVLLTASDHWRLPVPVAALPPKRGMSAGVRADHSSQAAPKIRRSLRSSYSIAVG